MSRETIHTFVPYLTPADWLVFLLPAVLSLTFFCVAIALLLRKRGKEGVPLGVAGLLLMGWWGQGLSSLNTVEFQGSTMSIVGPLTKVHLRLSQGNSVEEHRGVFLLLTQEEQAQLPRNGRWRWGEIWVDARYLVNEFTGRSQKRGPDGRILALQKPGDVQRHHRDKKQADRN